MTTTHAAPPPPPTLPSTSAERPATTLPRVGQRDGTAPLRSDNARLIQVGLFIAGAVLLPLGLVIICLGWYGIANTPYVYNQLVYIVSGGMLGLGVTFIGGFLYFGSWIARVGADLKESDKRLSDTLLLLGDSISHAVAAQSSAAAPVAQRTVGSVLVTAGNSTTVHRADCSLLEGRHDLTPVGPGAPGLTACRLCRPEE
ncbi:MAG TPA: hypothetical protein VN108_09420 [Marmoricola sp.]|nr:hypothetical protein [Marmoricola sp.]